MTAAKILSQNALEKIQNRFSMQEIGSPFLTLNSQMGPVGQCRIFQGDAVCKMVYIGMTVEAFGLDSHMIFAFTSPESAVPHFTLDSVMNGDSFAFHLDLIPRVDLGANLDYLMEVFKPLDETFASASKIEGLTPAHLGPTQYALMSPWMLAFRANATAFDAIQEPVAHYLEHWFTLVENGVSVADLSPADLSQRDQLNRNAIFNPQIDKVWAQVDRLVGEDVSAQLQSILRNQQVESLA
ncbi:hypothetical protein MASR2M15_26510 [Anaerolineales bacterium]